MSLAHAISIAATAHDGQIDKVGEPYILHPLRVMAAMKSETDRIVAVLHDVVEDSRDWQVSDIRSELGEEVAEAVEALTRAHGESYDAYLERVKKNPIAVRVKIADLRDNLDPVRVASAKKPVNIARYMEALEMLSEAPTP